MKTNQRELKFRVWDADKKAFLKRLQFEYVGIYDFQLTNIITKRNYIIQQFTGLKDSKGKEIYEGDILKWTNPADGKPFEVSIEKGNVNFGGQLATFVMNCVTGATRYEEYGLIDKDEYYEVIGNIFENSELIK